MAIGGQREQFLADIITTAIEGGIGYWSTTLQYQYDEHVVVGNPILGYGTHAMITPDDSSEVYRIEPLLIQQGIDKILGELVSISESTQADIERAWADLDAGDIDADAADAIVQVALFGKLVYG